MYLYIITLVVESCRDELVRKYMYNIFEVFVALKSTENNTGMVHCIALAE